MVEYLESIAVLNIGKSGLLLDCPDQQGAPELNCKTAQNEIKRAYNYLFLA